MLSFVLVLQRTVRHSTFALQLYCMKAFNAFMQYSCRAKKVATKLVTPYSKLILRPRNDGMGVTHSADISFIHP